MKGINRIYLYIIWCLCTVFLPLSAQTKEDADRAYGQEQYQKASLIYERLLKEHGQSAMLYMNLGDCYYRMDDMPRAVLNFQRARRLDPGDGQIRHNLKLAQSRITDQIVPQSEMFFVTWTRSWMQTHTAFQWGCIALGVFVLTLAGLALYLFCNRIWLRKTGFFGALVCLLLTVIFNLFAWRQKVALAGNPLAVVMSPAAEVKNTPATTSGKAFELHAGTTVKVTDNSLKDWKGIELEDGRTGWIRTSVLEMV